MSACNSKCTIRYIAGENKLLSFTASNCKLSNFTINSASYALYQYDQDETTDQPVTNGNCNILGKTLSFQLQIDTPGFYNLYITYMIGQEKLIAMFLVQVS